MIPEIIPSNVIHSEPTSLIEDDIAYAGISRANYQSLLASVPRLSKYILDNLSA
jgi:hypothetical protein